MKNLIIQLSHALFCYEVNTVDSIMNQIENIKTGKAIDAFVNRINKHRDELDYDGAYQYVSKLID